MSSDALFIAVFSLHLMLSSQQPEYYGPFESDYDYDSRERGDQEQSSRSTADITQRTLAQEPYFFSIGTNDDKTGKWEHTCGAVLINEQSLLSIASCFAHSPNSKYYIAKNGLPPSDALSEKNGAYYHKIEKFIYHSSFYLPRKGYMHYGNRSADYVIIVLEKPVAWGHHLHLPTQREIEKYVQQGTRPNVTAALGDDDNRQAEDLLVFKAPSLFREPGILEHYQPEYVLTKSQTIQFCWHDKGSPMWVSGIRGKVLLGMVFFPLYHCGYSRPDTGKDKVIYANLDPGMPWILKTLVEEFDCPCIGRNLFEWRFALNQKIDESIVLKPGETMWPNPDPGDDEEFDEEE